MNKITNEGAKVYTPFTLNLYDWWVLSISNNYAWRCPTKKYLLPHFLQHLSLNHLDIGVGTGYYLRSIPANCNISLMDLNSASLSAASAKVGEARIQSKIIHDVFECYPESLRDKFDSISMFYLLHCLPGSMSDKGTVIENAKMALTKDGVLYGATILGDGVIHNGFGKKLMTVYNRKGIFSNTHDSEDELRKILSRHFVNVEVIVKGVVALYTAYSKR
ncbi:class I SAM-dependent methyltransferase [Enterobacter hormaechei]|uniref:class I SAM-dependent methyltransferase n=1 Tax=Enterobacter TaxID=547 RepID=UPI00044D28CF|nr:MULTISPECIES: class I SAM-dependent methyltransferase [Enterobacter]MBE4901412.1 class I SAM-dependent methyltransferase [Enterobacter cloacae complex sp. P8RS]MBT2004528.1 methyltransferase [Enterobacter hormaechei subsp. xiangfangensis]OOK75176.1 SAM-dependent methyltransferase [Pedobacter himalayensis]EGQ5288413.1 class I SAM-dependent methyltransferase [Enterobacter hormaechei]ELC6491744.1 class I SAM-dependent methyltransferase [Enterobacter hormaechei]